MSKIAGNRFTTPSVPFADTKFNGGLNSTASPLNLQDNESPDLCNIDFDRFGSILKRNGYACLNTDAGTSIGGDGLYWFEYDNAGTQTRYAVRVYNGKLEKMDDLDGIWDDVTGGATITSANFCDFESFSNTLYAANGANVPFKWAGSGTANLADVPSGLTSAKFVKTFQNYLFYGNVVVSAVAYPTRIYWSDLRDPTTWDSANWIEVSKNDGQPITGLFVLANAAVIFKSRSIYNVFFTGDSTIPFNMQKSNSAVGCSVFTSIQAVDNGLVFFSNDGFYFYDGNTSTKISDKISATIDGFNSTNFTKIRSLAYRKKNMIQWTFTTSGETKNNRTVVWDYYNNAWSIYKGMSPSAMATFMVDGVSERPYFQDYNGFVYRADTGSNDAPLNTSNAIDAYYYTNWRSYQDAVNQKGVPHTYIYYKTSASTLTFSYSYDFIGGDTYSNTFSLAGGGGVWGTDTWNNFVWGGATGKIKRIDLAGRGRVIRYKFANNVLSETFRIDAFGQSAYLETNA